MIGGLPPIPSNTGRGLLRPVRVQVTVRTAAGVGGSHVFRFSRVGGKMTETSTRSISIGGGASCWRGGWFPRRQLESSTCRDPRSTNAWDRTPALDDCRPTLSLLGRGSLLRDIGVSSAMNPVLRVGLCVVKRVARAGRPLSTCTGSGQGGRGLGGVRHRRIAD